MRGEKRFLGFAGLLCICFAFLAVPVFAGSNSSNPKAPNTGKSSERTLSEGSEGRFEALEAADQFAEARTAPADSVDAGAFVSAFLSAKNLPSFGGSWTQITNQPYDSDAHGYRDPVWSNSGGGGGNVGGRMTAVAIDDSTSPASIYGGAADGGVWKSTNGGANWTPIFDDAPSLSIGSLAVNPSDHSLWVGTGEAGTSSDSYAGTGILRSANGGATFTQVGPSDQLLNHLTRRLAFDGNGNIFAATSRGLYKHSTSSASLGDPWTLVLKPCVAQHQTTFISDVAVKPGTGGNTVVAVVGWRGGSACNGFYVSTDDGATFNGTALPSTPAKITGAINESDLGRTTLAYSSDGSKLYALVQSAGLFNHPPGTGTLKGGTLLQGVYVSPTGSPTGSWQKIAESGKLKGSGSALSPFPGYNPGVQAWYNQYLIVDPSDSNHVYLGLEENFETTDGGQSWNAIGPYWNFGLKCAAGGLDNCPQTTHPDQHAAAISSNGTLFVANDGGMYSRPVRNAPAADRGWTNLNENLHALQYYFAGVGRSGTNTGGATTSSLAIWGGLQDNGVSLLFPAPTMVSPFGGDGGDLIVDPNNADRAVVEYVLLDMARTQNGGASDGKTPSFTEISPSCFAFTYTPSPCDPNPRFIAPFRADVTDINHWVAAGEFVWDNRDANGVGKGWDTSCSATSCDWKIVHDTGPGHTTTALAVFGDTIYAGWCGPCNEPGFKAGIDTNFGGIWHTIASSTDGTLPNRFVAALTVDSADPAHIFVAYNGFSRRWTNPLLGAGSGHVFESTDGGDSWTDLSGDQGDPTATPPVQAAADALPDAPATDVVFVNGRLIVATDIGVFVDGGLNSSWLKLGTGLPNASTNDLTLTPDGSTVVAATHGRGLWSIPVPSAPAP